MNDIKVPPFTDGQKKLIEMTEKLAGSRKICDVDDIDDVKDIKEIISETIAKIENQKQTNFQRITASPESLAEFISKATIAAWFAQANSELPKPNGSREWLAWLEQECETMAYIVISENGTKFGPYESVEDAKKQALNMFKSGFLNTYVIDDVTGKIVASFETHISKPYLGKDYSGIETMKKLVKEMQSDYKHSYYEDILGYVLWILDDYKRLKQCDGTNFSRIAKTPEALAEFMQDAMAYCKHCKADCATACGYYQQHEIVPCAGDGLVEWLKQESKE